MSGIRQACALGAALLASLAIVHPAGAAVVSVSTQDELDAAVRALQGGDTLLLAAGTYAELALDAPETGLDLDFADTVTIASADPDDPAVVNRMRLRGVSNVEIRGVTFDRAPSETEGRPVAVLGSSRITLDGVAFEGEVKDGFGVGVGLLVRRSRDVALIDSELSDFRNGLHVANSKDVTIRGNEFTGMSNDSMILGGIEGARIENNRFHDQKSPEDLRHKDSIQFHTRNGPSRDIEIRGNRIENPEVSQSIFFGNNVAREGDLDAFYADVVIEDNFIRGAHAHGITIEHGLRVRIEDNTVLQNPDLGHVRDVNVPIINVSSLSKDVTIRGNRVASVPEAQNATWDVSGNFTAGRNLKHWYGDYPAARGRTPNGEAPAEDASLAPRPRAGGTDDDTED
jgi:nitrous oxidase accessory protein NosD